MEDKSIKSFNLDEKINIIYNFVSNRLDDACFKVDKIDLKKITIDDIKIKNNLKEANEKIIQYIMEGNIQLKEKNKNSIILKRFSDYHSFDLVISPYKKSIKVNDILSNRDSLFSYILSLLVLNRKTESIVLPFINIDVELDLLKPLLKSLNLYEFYYNKMNNDEISNIISLKFRENFFKGINLLDFLQENKLNEKYLLFQIIMVLAVIQKEYPTFLHNDFKLKNILIFSIENADKKFMFSRDLFILPNLNFIIKIFNFSKSEMNGFSSKKFSQNRYSDLYDFLKDLHTETKFNNFSQETIDFINKIFPKNVRDKKPNKELFIPEKILEDSYFKSLKNKNINEKITSKPEYMNNNSDDTNKVFMTNLDSETKSILGDQDSISQSKMIRNEIKKGSKKLNRKLKISQDGGFRQSKSLFNSTKNNPNISNDARETFNKRRNEQPPPREPQVIAEQKLYDVKSKKSEPVLPQVYPPAHVPVPNPYYPNMNPQYAYGYKPNQIPVQKYYNITLANPVGNHNTVSQIYEDMIPGESNEFTMTSIFERMQLTNFLRSKILEKGDGEDISVSTGPTKSLLSFVRLIELNPYSLKTNPYQSLSKGFLLYTSAFPIRYKEENNVIDIAKNSRPINIRIYELSDGANKFDKLSKEIAFDDFEVWREIRYYEFVREQIIKQKVSPNFVSIYMYTIDKVSRIDYSKIDMIKSKNIPKNVIFDEIENDQKVNNLYTIDPIELLIQNKYPSKTELTNITITNQDKINIGKFLLKNKYIFKITNSNNKYEWTESGIEYIQKNNFYNYLNQYKPVKGKKITNEEIVIIAKAIGKPDLTKYSNTSLVALTEAPTSNILQWASPLIEKFGSINKMIETGYHSPNVWKSIIFQLVYTCAVLQKAGILFTNFSLENNIFIRDLYSEDGKRGHWIYMVDDFEFFIPNYGYLLMFDSRYADIFNSTTQTLETSSSARRYKINSTKLYNKNEFDNSLNNSFSNQKFKSIIDPDNFRTNLEKVGGDMPDKEVQDLLHGLYKDTKDDTVISDLLVKHFPMYLNNRVGTLLTKEEIDNLPLINNYNFTVGDLVAWEESYKQYKWVVIIEINNSGIVKVQASDKVILTEVSKFSLNKYPESETIKQKTLDGINLDPNFTIETYNLKNLII